MAGHPMDTAPKDRPILAWCDHEADPQVLKEFPDGRRHLTLYAAHSEGMGYVPTGWAIVEWGGAFNDSNYEYPNGANLPDWWFQAGTDFEIAANPVEWWPLPERIS